PCTCAPPKRPIHCSSPNSNATLPKLELVHRAQIEVLEISPAFQARFFSARYSPPGRSPRVVIRFDTVSWPRFARFVQRSLACAWALHCLMLGACSLSLYTWSKYGGLLPRSCRPYLLPWSTREGMPSRLHVFT